MNTLKYVSRQFDVLASNSSAIARSAPTSPSPENMIIEDDSLRPSSTISLPEIRNRRISQRSPSDRSKAQAFLRGSRRKTQPALDPSDIPLPPSPSLTMSAFLPELRGSLASSSSSSSQIYRNSPSPASRRKRRRRTASYWVLRPFIVVWYLLLGAWYWLTGNRQALRKRRRSSTPATPEDTNQRSQDSVPSVTQTLWKDDSHADEQSDETLVDSDADEEVVVRAHRPLLENISLKPTTTNFPALSERDQGPDSFATSASILMPSDFPGRSTVEDDSSTSSRESAFQGPSASGRIRISLPAFANVTGGSERWLDRGSRPKLTPFPSRERIPVSEHDEDPGSDELVTGANEDAEMREVEQSLARRRRSNETSTSTTTPMLSHVNFNIPIPVPLSNEQGKELEPGRPAIPRTIVTPPSNPSIRPEPPLIPTRTERKLLPPSQQLLPNRLGTSYFSGPSSSNRKLSSTLPRRYSPDYAYDSSSNNAAQSGGGSAPRVTPFHRPKTLVLDLDETLIHSTSASKVALPSHSSKGGSGMLNELGGLFIGGGSGGGFGGTGLFSSGMLAGAGGLLGKAGDRQRAGHMVEVVLNGRSTLYTVYKRPFVDYFLRKVSGWYTLVVFTASMQEYADPVIDWLDQGRGIFGKRYFRESCTQLPNGSYAKDLSVVDPDLTRICLLDNSPSSYSLNQPNGIGIEGWYSDPFDEALLDLLPVLDSLRFTSDVRHVLGIKMF